MTAAIQLNNVTYSVDGTEIIRNVSGAFTKGAVTTVVGPSGAGKTTLFRLCNGLRSATSGEISILDKKMEAYNPVELRRTVGIALQNATMIDGTVKDNLELPLTLQGKQIEQEEAEELMETVGLKKEFLSKSSKDLSGGQKQKLSIARTLVNRPDILLLDEITSSLDRVSQKDIEELIVEVNRKYGTTVIWITHNLDQALRIGSYTWVMMEGELVESGKSDLLHHPEDPRVKEFVKGEAQ